MCKNCYHYRGREKLADKCPHPERANYAHGVCKNCYLSAYHKERRAANKEFLRSSKGKEFEEINIDNLDV